MNQKILALLAFSIFILSAIPFVLGLSGVISSGVGVIVHAGGSGSSTSTPGNQCANNLTSCGTYPSCQDLTTLSTCVSGHVAVNYCSSNQAQVSLRSSTCDGSSSSSSGTGVTAGDKSYSLKFNITDDNGDPQIIHLKLHKAGFSDSLAESNVDGQASVSSSQGNVDLDLTFNNELDVKVKNLDATHFGSDYKKIIIEQKAAEISDKNILKAFKVELPSGLTYTSILLTIDFSDAIYDNINNIFIYKCPSASYNPTTDTCNTDWVKYTPTIDSMNKVATLEITSFSVFALAEDTSTSTTTTTASTTTTQPISQNTGSSSTSSSSSSGSSSSSNINSGIFDESTGQSTSQSSQERPVEIVVANDTTTSTTSTTLPSNATSSVVTLQISNQIFELFLFAMMLPTSIISFYFYRKFSMQQVRPMGYSYSRRAASYSRGRATNYGRKVARSSKAKLNETRLIL